MNETAERLLKLLNRLKDDRRALLIIGISFLGVLLIFLSEVVPSGSSDDEQMKVNKEQVYADTKDELVHIIGKIEGVGKTEVMVTYDGTAEKVYAYDLSEQGTDTETKREEEHIILDKGNTEEGLPVREIFPRVNGIAVVCEGGGSPKVKNEITNMLKALYGISSNNISISEMNG